MITTQNSAVARTISRLLIPFIQLFGLYVIMHGHSSPGGGFQGGVILASSFILMAVGIDLAEVKRRFPPLVLATFTSIGVLLYATIGMLSLVLGGNFLDYGVIPIPDARSVGMLGIEIGVGITVTASIVSIFCKLITFE